MKRIVAVLLFVVTTVAHAACPQLYPAQQPIAPGSTSIVELCNSFYVSHYNQDLSRVVFTAERLSPGTTIGAPTRLSGFRPDPRVKNSPRDSIYNATNFDRGHMVPAEDSSTNEEMYDTFFLTNAVPQNPTLNRGKWKQLEAHIRSRAVISTADTYVVTIPIYPAAPTLMSNRIPIPSGIWKIEITATGERYFFADNTALSQALPYTKVDWRKIIKTQSQLR